MTKYRRQQIAKTTNLLPTILATLGIVLVATGLFMGNVHLSTIGGISAALSLLISR